jgi:hypothetical protein
MENRINNLKFFTGGRALFTVSNGKGEHYTFRINKPKKDDKGNPPYFISMLTGPDNTSNYTYLGLYIPQFNTVRLTSKSKFASESTPVKVLNWAFKKVAEGGNLPEGYSIAHEGYCCKCGKLLTDPISIEMGIGPNCRRSF